MGRKRTEIIIETERTLLITRRRFDNSLSWCDSCGKLLPMLTVEEAAAVMRVQAEEIFRKLEDRELHCVRMADGQPRICPNSLLS